MTCECPVCLRNSEVQRRLALLEPSERMYWEAMYEHLTHVEMDLDVAKAVIDGSWPGADE